MIKGVPITRNSTNIANTRAGLFKLSRNGKKERKEKEKEKKEKEEEKEEKEKEEGKEEEKEEKEHKEEEEEGGSFLPPLSSPSPLGSGGRIYLWGRGL